MEPSNDNSFGSLGSNEGGVGGMAVAGGANNVGGANGPAMGTSGVDSSVAMQRASGVNNVGTSMAFTMPAASSETGDIVINNDEKKSKKSLFVGLMVAIVLLAVGGIVAIMMFGGGQGHESTRAKFNRLVNYVVSGEESTSNYSLPFENGAKYYFNEQQSIDEKRIEVYSKTSALLDDFLTAYNETTDKNAFATDDAKFSGIMDDENQILDFSLLVNSKPIPSLRDVIKVRRVNNVDGTKKYYDDYYDFSSLNSDRYVDAFRTVFGDYVDVLVNITEIYIDNGCISGDLIKSGCIENSGDEGLISTFNKKVGEARGLKTDANYYYNLCDFFVVRLFDALNYVKGSTAFVTGGSLYV